MRRSPPGRRVLFRLVVLSKFIVQRVIANAGKLSAAELGKLSQTTRNAFKKLGHSIRLVQSFVTGDKLHWSMS